MFTHVLCSPIILDNHAHIKKHLATEHEIINN